MSRSLLTTKTVRGMGKTRRAYDSTTAPCGGVGPGLARFILSPNPAWQGFAPTGRSERSDWPFWGVWE